VIELGREMLAAVTGGDTSTNTTSVGPVSYSQTRTDYAKCVDNVTSQTAAQYPSTVKWYNPFTWGSDGNAAARGQATMQNMRTTCGLPTS
jgi:hypothetical protein